MIHIKYRIRKYYDSDTYVDKTRNAIYPDCCIEMDMLYCKDKFKFEYISLDAIDELSVGDTVIIFGRHRTPNRKEFIKAIFPYLSVLNFNLETIEKVKRGDK